MKTRQEIKAYAKQTFMAQYSNSVLALFLVLLLTTGFALISATTSIFNSLPHLRNAGIMTMSSGQFILINTVIPLISIPVSILTMVLSVNLCGVFVKVYYGQQIIAAEPYHALKFNFGRKLGGMFWEILWIYLWALVGIFTLFIPTVIKALSYSMTPYILANNPNVTATDALSLSKRMTNGHKGEIFVMYLSFFGWQLLNMLTLGILGIFYVNPYMYTSLAGLFVELRNTAVVTGVIHPQELDGIQQYYYQQPAYPAAQPYDQPPPPPPPPAPPAPPDNENN